jgi:hypothetical protein
LASGFPPSRARSSTTAAGGHSIDANNLTNRSWAIFGGLIALLAIYFVGAEQGATALFPGVSIHEFVHDGRHLLGFPCY